MKWAQMNNSFAHILEKVKESLYRPEVAQMAPGS
jgi:hypothetical protein